MKAFIKGFLIGALLWAILYVVLGMGRDSGIETGRRLEREAHVCFTPPTERTRIQIDAPGQERIILYGWFTTPKGEKER